jgi:pyruvate dehydrogenase E2 component (dihydrolipoamide acetyltransferase)
MENLKESRNQKKLKKKRRLNPKDEKKKETKEEKQKGERKSVHPMELDEQPPIIKGAAPAAPSVRRIAREIGVDINKVPGSGPNGRISMDDVKAYSKKLHESRSEGVGIGIKKQSLPDFSKFGKIEKAEMSNIRKKTAEHLSYAWATIPHVTQFDKADITNLEKTRKQLSKVMEKEGAKLTVTGILVKVLIEALKKFPQFNSSIDMEKKEIIYKKYFNIGIAVDTEHGLIVPVIKNADQKSLTEISIEMNDLAEKARNKKIGLEDLQGGSMTITNLGGIGGTYFTPIVHTPEVAILGVSRGAYEPVWNGHGVFEPRFMLPLSLSYDHRIIDGADAIRFLRFVVEALENPIKLVL